MAATLPPLLKLPFEIREDIYKLVLLDPTEPSFDRSERSGSYRHYLGLLFANRQMYGEVRDILETLRPFSIISCNIDNLGALMSEHALPYVSDHDVGKVRCSSVRLHVKFPVCKKDQSILTAYVVLSSTLKRVCALFRSLSLTIPHAPGQPIHSDGSEFPRMQIAIRLGSASYVLPRQKQVQMLQQMAWLNHIGKITIHGSSDMAVKTLLPGHDERLPPAPFGDIPRIVVRVAKFRNFRARDVREFIRLTAWKNSIAATDFRNKNYDLALDRYMGVLSFIDTAAKNNPYMLQVDDHSPIAVDEHSFCAELGLVKSCMGAKNWEDAAFHIKPIMKDIRSRPCVTGAQFRFARGLERQIKQVLGAKYEE